MIEEIRIRDIGGISQAVLTLSSPFIAITGESGSGKSSLVRAFEMLSGARSQSSIIHGDSDEAEILAVLEGDGLLPGLSEELQPQEGTTIIRRILSRAGRSRTYLQGKPVPLSTLTHAMTGQLGIQSQFAQLGLLDPQGQLDLLDSFGPDRISAIRSEIRLAVSRGLDREREIVSLKEKRKKLEEQWGKAQEVLDRMGSLKLKAGQDQEWAQELEGIERRLNQGRRLENLKHRLLGAGSERGITEELENSLMDLRDCFSCDDGTHWTTATEQVLSGLQTLQRLLIGHLQAFPPEELEAESHRIEQSLGKVRQLQRLARVDSYEALLDYCEKARHGLRWVIESGHEIDRLQSESREYRKKASGLALELRNLRQEAAAQLTENMNRYLADLAMENLAFSVQLLPLDRIRSTGADDVSFELQGEGSFRGPVNRIASGGELSRILLALQLCLPEDRTPRCLVFDEVEAGLGGRAALLAGLKLRDLSRRCRVLLVTHEAAIAALADQHYVVRREGNESLVSEIGGDERVGEIARMLAGNSQSHEARIHAEALLSGTPCDVP